MEPQELSLECEALDDFRDNFSTLLKTLMDELVKRDLEIGTITAKIKITRKTTESFGGPMLTMIGIEPDLSLKIGAEAKAKLRKQDGIYMRYNAEGSPIISTKQTSLERYLWEDQKQSAV